MIPDKHVYGPLKNLMLVHVADPRVCSDNEGPAVEFLAALCDKLGQFPGWVGRPSLVLVDCSDAECLLAVRLLTTRWCSLGRFFVNCASVLWGAKLSMFDAREFAGFVRFLLSRTATHRQLCACRHVYAHPHAHDHNHTRTHAQTHTHTHTNTHTYTYTRVRSVARSLAVVCRYADFFVQAKQSSADTFLPAAMLQPLLLSADESIAVRARECLRVLLQMQSPSVDAIMIEGGMESAFIVQHFVRLCVALSPLCAHRESNKLMIANVYKPCHCFCHQHIL